MPMCVTSYGLGLSTAFTVSASAASDTDTPSLTSAAACFRLAGVIRFGAPISSSLPQRPQLESSFFHFSYCSAVTACGSPACARMTTTVPASTRHTAHAAIPTRRVMTMTSLQVNVTVHPQRSNDRNQFEPALPCLFTRRPQRSGDRKARPTGSLPRSQHLLDPRVDVFVVAEDRIYISDAKRAWPLHHHRCDHRIGATQSEQSCR